MATLALSNEAQRHVTALILLLFCAAILLPATPNISFRARPFSQPSDGSAARQAAPDQNGTGHVRSSGTTGEAMGDLIARQHAILVSDRPHVPAGGLARADTPARRDEAQRADPPPKPVLPPLKMGPSYEDDALIAEQVVVWSKRRDLSPLLVWVVIDAESEGNPRAVSREGALGLMQVMPLHFRPDDDPFDIATNIERGTGVLAAYLADTASLKLALAAYNAGPATVRQYGGVPPFPETSRYLSKTLDRYYELLDLAKARGVEPFTLRYAVGL